MRHNKYKQNVELALTLDIPRILKPVIGNSCLPKLPRLLLPPSCSGYLHYYYTLFLKLFIIKLLLISSIYKLYI